MRSVSFSSKRWSRPRLESLEQRSLLSGGLTDTLTTDKSVYQIGEPIKFTFTETNTTSEPIQIAIFAGDDGFNVDEAGSLVWKSNSGAIPMVIALETLQPGHSRTFASTWDGVPDTGNPPVPGVMAPGIFTVTNQLSPDGPAATFQIASKLSYSLTTDQSDYRIGQPVQFTLTETNVTDQPISVDVAPTNFTVTSDGSAVWQSDTSGTTTTQTLAPGQSIIQSGTWNGIANTGSLLGTNAWGPDFVVSSPNTPAGLTAGFMIDNPISTSLSTQTPDVEAGQPVILTFTETNTSSEPVTVLDGDGTFQVTDGITGSTVFSYTETTPATAVMLQPGQSLTQTATWNTDASTTLPGSYSGNFSDGKLGARTNLWIQSSGPITVPPNIPVTLPISATLATAHSTYKPGNRVAISLTLTNLSSQSVALGTTSGSAGFKIYRGSVLVGEGSTRALVARGRSAARAQKLLAAGKSKTIDLSWVARPSLHGARPLKAGVYTIEAWDGAYSASTTIQLGS
jgi:hypothetical protein